MPLRTYADFQDTRNSRVLVRESSEVAPEADAVWIFVSTPVSGSIGAHLNPSQARLVVAALQEHLARVDAPPTK
jgi:hypothetical protein